jgi:LPS sulfotransferase NodH
MADLPEPEVPVATTYVIASTMRTGSYLLCEGLYATGCAGNPREVFCPERRGNYCGEWQLPPNISFDEYLHAAIRKGTTYNGVCGMKIHGHHVEPLSRQRGEVDKPWNILTQLFPAAKYIHLRRHDRRAQAISWYRAKVTNEWFRIPGKTQQDLTGKEPRLEMAEIRRMEIELENQDRSWKEFFSEHSIVPLQMDYETLEAGYRGEIARALEFLGQDPDIARDIPEPRLVRQRDALTDEWHRLMDEEFSE